MTDIYQLTNDILKLVDSNPMNYVDMSTIIEKYTYGLDREGQREPRGRIRTTLMELKQDGEIDFSDQNISNLTTTMGGVYVSSSGMIRSTRKRQKEIEDKKINLPSNKIRLITRRNIIDSFSITRIAWYGKLDQPSFLGRLFNLAALPSTDPRYTTANEDIHKHTVMNDDWPEEWVFTDTRFNIFHISDNDFLDFLCMTIHPAVRDNADEVITLLEIYLNNLKRDGITLYKSGDIAGRPVFSHIEEPSANASNKTIIINPIKSEIKKALVIGCSKYLHATPLVNPLNDANSMEVVLKKLDFEVFKIIDPTQKELKIAIDEFGSKLKGADIGLLYFAGHGVQVKGLNYIIPSDANLFSEKMVEYDCVEAGRILAHMEEAKTNINIIILDACRNNPFERSWGRGTNQRGLATMSAPKGSLIAYSTEPGNTASDGDGLNGLYTEALLNNIETKNVAILTMFQKVRLEVMEKSKEEQMPWESTSLTSDFYFNR